jgi:PEP-CTERM motif
MVEKLPSFAKRILGVAMALAGPGLVHAAGMPFNTIELSQYLLVGMGPVNTVNMAPGVGQAVNENNYELGANKQNTPSRSGTPIGSSIRGNAPNIPLNAKIVGTGIFGDGNVAVTHASGVFNLQNVGVYANLGIRCAQNKVNCDVGTSNSFFNDPNQFPNTFVTTGNGNPVNNNTDGTGVNVNPNQALQSARIDKPTQAGVTGNFNFNMLLAEIAAEKAMVPALAATATINLNNSGGKFTKDIDNFLVTNDGIGGSITVTDTQIMDGRGGSTGDNMSQVGNTRIMLDHGLNVIDLITAPNGTMRDFLLQESSLVIDGYADSSVIFRVSDAANFLVSNANILVGNSGIGLNSVLFYSDKPDNNAHFALSNSVVNGVAFHTVGGLGGEINFQNVQGCTQLVADKINLSDVRLTRCAPGGTHVPEPGSLALLALGAFGIGLVRRRRRN